MTDHLTQPQPGTPALDYEAVKDFFFKKLEQDRHGRGRMESAQFHTAMWIFEQGCHERERLLAEIERLGASVRWHIRTYRVADEAWDRDAEEERLFQIEMMKVRNA